MAKADEINEEWYFGYGSLIYDPVYKGHKLEEWCEPPIDGEIESGMEFLHTSKSRGEAPTLCFDGTKRITKGKCWRAEGKERIDAARKYLENREGKITKIEVKMSDGRIVQAYCGNTSPDLKGKTVEEIAARAIESEKKATAGRGGVIYIRKCKEFGIITPMLEELLRIIDKK